MSYEVHRRECFVLQTNDLYNTTPIVNRVDFASGVQVALDLKSRASHHTELFAEFLALPFLLHENHRKKKTCSLAQLSVPSQRPPHASSLLPLPARLR